MLDVRRLQIIAAVADEGSFTAAARRLHLTQSAVSQQMSALEQELGVVLLERMARGVRLTPAGQALVVRTKRLFRDITTVEQEIRAFGEGPQEIRLGAFASAGVELLPLALKEFRTRRPGVRILLSSADEPLAQLREGTVHALLTWEYTFAPQPLDPGLTQLRLPDDPLRVLLPADHPLAREEHLTLAELSDERWVVRSHRAPYEDAYQRMCRTAGFEPQIAFKADDYESLQGLVAANMGVSLIPVLSINPFRDDVVTCRLSTPEFARRVTAVTLSPAAWASPMADFLEILRTTAEEIHRPCPPAASPASAGPRPDGRRPATTARRSGDAG